MNKYVCKVCGYIENRDKIDSDFVCPICGVSAENFNLVEDCYDLLGLEDIIDSVIEENSNVKSSKIINNEEEDKRVRISEYNHCISRVNEKCINCGQCKKTAGYVFKAEQ